jgi:DHA2 family methylenomycin A resistance protein-like MFS transporter
MATGALTQAVSSSPVVSVLALAMLGTGVSLTIPALLAAVTSAAPRELTATAAGALNAARQTGASLGVTTLGSLLTTTTTSVALMTAAALLLTGAAVTFTMLARARTTRDQQA